MRKYQVLPHTADTRLKIEADSLQELFRAGLEGMNFIMKSDYSVESSMMNLRDVIEVSSIDESMLLVDFLSTVLSLSHQHKAVYRLLDFNMYDKNKIIANIAGDYVEGFNEDIKAVTYTEAQITINEKNNFETIIVFDI